MSRLILTEQGKENRRKRRERKAALHRWELQALRVTGATCATCLHFERKVFSAGNKDVCQLGSDFHGYQIAKPDGLCRHFEGAT